MGKLWNQFKENSQRSRGVNGAENLDIHSGQSQSQWFWHWNLGICTGGLVVIIVLNLFHVYQIGYRGDKDMEKALNMIAAYMASATREEYDDIAKAIRHDLICSEFGEDIVNLMRYIPNTADLCHTCMDNYTEQIFLVCANTGEMYPLDLFHSGENPDAHYGGEEWSFGYDEISQTHLHISKSPGQKEGYAELYRERGIVSVHRMKTLFCENCIEEMLGAVSGQAVGEFVMFDSLEKAFYPVGECMTVQAGDYILETVLGERGYRIEIRYIGKEGD